MTALRMLVGISAAAAGAVAARGALRRSDPKHELMPGDRAHVEVWVAEQVTRLRALSYEQLRLREGQDFHCDVLTPSGLCLLGETSVFWDDPTAARNLRVLVDAALPRSGWISSIAKHDFIRAPDGSFIDE